MQKTALIQQETMMIPLYNDAYMIDRPVQDSSYVNGWPVRPMLRIHLLGTFQVYEQLIHSEQRRPSTIMKHSGSDLETLYALHSEQYGLCECC